MRSLAPYLVTLPLLASPAAPLWIKPVMAETVSAEQALTLLAKSNAADAKCRHLSSSERQELADYLARAEVAETSRSSSAKAQAIIERGRADGRESLCGEESRAEVDATLTAARDAIDHGPPRRQVAERPAVKEKVAAPKVSRVRTTGKLANYGDAAMAYYIERRCNHLSPRQARAFWDRIVAQHAHALKTNGKRAVAAALKTAEARASRKSCGMRTAALVKAASGVN
jgi:hypothetical protein